MNQVAIVEVTQAGRSVGLGVYFNGAPIYFSDMENNSEVSRAKAIASAIAKAIGQVALALDYSISETVSDWGWKEIQQDLVNSGKLTPPMCNNSLMKGFYRCTTCFSTWSLCDEFNEAQTCQQCSQVVEPYFSGPPRSTSDDALEALAKHEKCYPNSKEQGEYIVEVSRSGYRSKIFTVTDATGPAGAHLKALAEAGGVEFPAESSADYEVLYAAPYHLPD